jgi:LmbE family N-acetylglucosaminyl deacetylase/glycosyltransferase involved in cell wall biosynthesis
MSDKIDISVVVITHNKASYLEACLNCLGQTTFARHRFEVIVVNDGSTDRTRDLLDAYSATYTLSAIHKEQGGISSARNAGIADAAGELLVMLDEDCLPDPSALQNLWDAYRANPTALFIANVIHIDVCHVSGVCARVNRGSMDFMETVDTLSPQAYTFALQPILRSIKEHLDELEVGWIGAQGPSVSMSRQMWAEVGGYDETFRKYGMEDFDLAFRFRSQGGRLLYVENAILYHLDHGHDKTRLFAEATLSVKQFYRKHAATPEAKPFMDFILGGISFLAFNNRVARLKGKAEVDLPCLDKTFSAYEMAKYRGSQVASQPTPPVEYRYNSSQQFCLNLLVKKLRHDIDLDPPQAAEKLAFEKGLHSRVLVVAPHMDDEVIGCGGAIASCAEAGIRMSVAFCTSGAGGVVRRRQDQPSDVSQVTGKRVDESREAASLLGIEQVVHLNGAEGRLSKNPGGAAELIDLCNNESFDTVFIPGAREMHPDHIVVSRWITDHLSRLTKAKHIFEYEVWGSCSPTHYIDLDSKAWERKRKALLAYDTQLKELDYLTVMDFLATTRGVQIGSTSGRAEVYRRIR